ncbi:MAG: IPT/TIG domain-containing protein, partial [bacterium]|nr:IPT/TIG domain-containing protein [bacterium]
SINAINATNQSYQNWKYTTVPSGTMTLTAPRIAGTYEVRYLKNDGYTSVAKSAQFTVGAVTPIPPTEPLPPTTTPNSPAILSLTPSSGLEGSLIIISGSNFTPSNNKVLIDGNVFITASSTNNIIGPFTLPEFIQAGKSSWTIQVENANGRSNGAAFKIEATTAVRTVVSAVNAPSLSPRYFDMDYKTGKFTIKGTNFTSSNKILLDGKLFATLPSSDGTTIGPFGMPSSDKARYALTVINENGISTAYYIPSYNPKYYQWSINIQSDSVYKMWLGNYGRRYYELSMFAFKGSNTLQRAGVGDVYYFQSSTLTLSQKPQGMDYSFVSGGSSCSFSRDTTSYAIQNSCGYSPNATNVYGTIPITVSASKDLKAGNYIGYSDLKATYLDKPYSITVPHSIGVQPSTLVLFVPGFGPESKDGFDKTTKIFQKIKAEENKINKDSNGYITNSSMITKVVEFEYTPLNQDNEETAVLLNTSLAKVMREGNYDQLAVIEHSGADQVVREAVLLAQDGEDPELQAFWKTAKIYAFSPLHGGSDLAISVSYAPGIADIIPFVKRSRQLNPREEYQKGLFSKEAIGKFGASITSYKSYVLAGVPLTAGEKISDFADRHFSHLWKCWSPVASEKEDCITEWQTNYLNLLSPIPQTFNQSYTQYSRPGRSTNVAGFNHKVIILSPELLAVDEHDVLLRFDPLVDEVVNQIRGY